MLRIARKLGYADLKSFDAAIAKNPTCTQIARADAGAVRKSSTDVAKLPQYSAASQGEGGGDAGRGVREREASGAQ